ncbi:DJ-1/PfpI family protein [Candidatus Poribacteria bacterium]|nr:DJ-1/PfpI family protein [Candidatus Poribacteria bacterium]
MINKKAVFIIAHNIFRDEELLVPKEVLSNAGITVKIASSKTTTATGKLGAKVNPDFTIDSIIPENFDAIIFVGGTGAKEYFDNPIAHKIAIQALDKGKIVAAICIAPAILAKAGILKNKMATVFPSEIDTLKKFNAIYIQDKKVIVDGNIITAAGPEAAKEFGEAILKKIKADSSLHSE